MFKYRIRLFFNELKLLVLMRRGRPEPEPGRRGCGWGPFSGCAAPRDDEVEYYGEPRPRSLAPGDKDPPPGPPAAQPPAAALDAVSLSSSLDSGARTPQCRICFQGPEQVRAGIGPRGDGGCQDVPRRRLGCGEPTRGHQHARRRLEVRAERGHVALRGAGLGPLWVCGARHGGHDGGRAQGWGNGWVQRTPWAGDGAGTPPGS